MSSSDLQPSACSVRTAVGLRAVARRFVMLSPLVVILSLLLISGEASAAAPGSGATFDESNVNYDPGPTQRRGGFFMGLNPSYGLGEYKGYPLEVEALNDPEAKQTTGPAFASQFSLWIGVAIRDFLTFGVGTSLLSARGTQFGGGLALLVHVEAYPFFYMGKFYQNFGLSFEGGLGVSAIVESEKGKPGDVVANGGAMSTLGLGAFWEPLRFWHFSAGPTVNYVHGFSQTMQTNQATLGFRFVFYGKQPKKKSQAAQHESALLQAR